MLKKLFAALLVTLYFMGASLATQLPYYQGPQDVPNLLGYLNKIVNYLNNPGTPPYINAANNNTANIICDGQADNWATFETLINLAASQQKTLYVPAANKNCLISRALQYLDVNGNHIDNFDLEVSNGATIECTGTAAGIYSHFPFAGCSFSGGGGDGGLVAPNALSAVSVGATTLTFTTGGTAAGFAVGDIVLVETTTTYAAFGLSGIPTWGQFDRVQSVNAGANTITVQDPIEAAIASAQLIKQTNNGQFIQAAPGGASNVPQYASYNLTVNGGNWIADNTPAGGFFDGGPCVHCKLSPHSIVAAYGIGYSNGYAKTVLSADNETISCEIAEFSYVTTDTTLTVGNVDMPSGCATLRVIGIDESSRANTMNIGNITLAQSQASDLIFIVGANGNRINVSSVQGNIVQGNIADIQNYGFTTNFPGTSFNYVEVDSVNLVSVGLCASFSGASTAHNIIPHMRCNAAGYGGSNTTFYHTGDGAGNYYIDDWANFGYQTYFNENFVSAVTANVTVGPVPAASGTCAVNTQTGGQTAGTFKANGACAAGTVILNIMPNPPSYDNFSGANCIASDLTTTADVMKFTAATPQFGSMTVTFTGTMVSGDVVAWNCQVF